SFSVFLGGGGHHLHRQGLAQEQEVTGLRFVQRDRVTQPHAEPAKFLVHFAHLRAALGAVLQQLAANLGVQLGQVVAAQAEAAHPEGWRTPGPGRGCWTPARSRASATRRRADTAVISQASSSLRRVRGSSKSGPLASPSPRPSGTPFSSSPNSPPG